MALIGGSPLLSLLPGFDPNDSLIFDYLVTLAEPQGSGAFSATATFTVHDGDHFSEYIAMLNGMSSQGFICGSIEDGTWLEITNTPVPEPGTMILFCTGLIGLAAARRRLKK